MSHATDNMLVYLGQKILLDLQSPDFKSELYYHTFDLKECVFQVRKGVYSNRTITTEGLSVATEVKARTYLEIGVKRKTDQVPLVCLMVEPSDVGISDYEMTMALITLMLLYDSATQALGVDAERHMMETELAGLAKGLPGNPDSPGLLNKMADLITRLKNLEGKT